MKMNLYFLFLLFLANIIFCQTKTTNSIHGYDWKDFDNTAKFSHLIGIDNGKSWTLTLLSNKIKDKKLFNELVLIISNEESSTVNYSAFIQEMDSFYKEGSNMRIPIIFAYHYVKMKFKGYLPSQLDSLKAEYRKWYNE